MKFSLKKVGDKVLLKTALESTAYAISKLAKKNLCKGRIGNLLGEDAKVAVEVPVSRTLFSEEKCDFLFALLSCSSLPETISDSPGNGSA